MGETRVDLVHLLQDLRDAYPGSIEETIVTEMVANALDSGADVIEISTDSTALVFPVKFWNSVTSRWVGVATSTSGGGGGLMGGGVVHAESGMTSHAKRASRVLADIARDLLVPSRDSSRFR